MKRIHIMLAANGGVEQSARNLAIYLARNGHNVVYSIFVKEKTPHDDLISAGVKVDSYADNLLFLNKLGKVGKILRFATIFLKFIKKEKPKYLLVWAKEMILICTMLRFLLPKSKIAGACVIHTSEHLNRQARIKRAILKFLYGKYLKKADIIIACSESMKKDLIYNYNVPNNKALCIYGPVKKEYFDVDLYLNNSRSNNILYVGRLAPVKNLDEMFYAFKIVKENIKDATLTLVGSGECESDLKNKAAEIGLQDSIIFAGQQNDIISYYNKAGVFALSSHYEGFPMVLMEATICGVPIVSYDCPSGPDEIIVEGENGFLVKQYEIDSLALKIEEALNKKWNKEKIRELSMKCHPDVIFSKFEKELIKLFR